MSDNDPAWKREQDGRRDGENGIPRPVERDEDWVYREAHTEAEKARKEKQGW